MVAHQALWSKIAKTWLNMDLDVVHETAMRGRAHTGVEMIKWITVCSCQD